ncbi:hypothetical protein, variant [Aphanomyces invadans]|uniref:Uncharacterized protein n=1 Tax=Aphanomyces invadans TaxID=157072 RepID=A0A024TIS4_9STRA|nr:hypothetical protein, variant [Aphanomyces invadans]ETV93257.1 hypothetical protein, variant [Aphanomyces invadans]|eukprot:XP_008878091.1 hypothetical protein, variant [Aphanomyces invadans]
MAAAQGSATLPVASGVTAPKIGPSTAHAMIPPLVRENSQPRATQLRGSGRRLLEKQTSGKSNTIFPRLTRESSGRDRSSQPDTSGRERSQRSSLQPQTGHDSNWSMHGVDLKSSSGTTAAKLAEYVENREQRAIMAWRLGDYVLAKCHSSDEYFAGHILDIDDGDDGKTDCHHDSTSTLGAAPRGRSVSILFDDLTLDKHVPLENIQTILGQDFDMELQFVPMEDHKDDDSEGSVVPDAAQVAASQNEIGIDAHVLAHIKMALPSPNSKPSLHQDKANPAPYTLHRSVAVVYDDQAIHRGGLSTAEIAVYSKTSSGQSEALRDAADQTLRRMHATYMKMKQIGTRQSSNNDLDGPPPPGASTRRGSSSKQMALLPPNADHPTTDAIPRKHVLVHALPLCYFGSIQPHPKGHPAPNDAVVVQDLDQKLHDKVAPAKCQPCDPTADLFEQYVELAKVHDLVYPGAKVLSWVRDQLVPCTIRRRRCATAFDVKVDGEHDALTSIPLEHLVAVPRSQSNAITATNDVEIDVAGQTFCVHERIIVHDLELGVSNHGYIVGINSNRTVFVEYDNGEVDSSVPSVFLRKADSSSREAGAFLMSLDIHQTFGMGATEEGFNIDDWVTATHPMSNLLEKGRVCNVHNAHNTCDIQFADGVILKQASFHTLQHAAVPATKKPPAFLPLDHVLAYSPRFAKYCTGQIQAVAAATNAYRVVYDYGETYDGVPYDYIAPITDTTGTSDRVVWLTT